MSDRAELLKLLVNERVVELVRERLGDEGIADLVCEMVNPHRPLTTAQRAKLAGVTDSAIRQRNRRFK